MLPTYMKIHKMFKCKLYSIIRVQMCRVKSDDYELPASGVCGLQVRYCH